MNNKFLDKFAVATSKVLYDAAKFGKEHRCPRCGRTDWNVVPLFEYGDTRQPSQIVLFCRKCQYNQPFAAIPFKEAISYAEKKMMEKRAAEIAKEEQGFKAVGQDEAGQHIDFNWKQKAQKLWKEKPAFRKLWRNLSK